MNEEYLAKEFTRCGKTHLDTIAMMIKDYNMPVQVALNLIRGTLHHKRKCGAHNVVGKDGIRSIDVHQKDGIPFSLFDLFIVL